jgi:hypothetical protein
MGKNQTNALEQIGDCQYNCTSFYGSLNLNEIFLLHHLTQLFCPFIRCYIISAVG